MGSIWFLGFIGILVGRVVYAGMKTEELFFRPPTRYEDKDRKYVDGDKVFQYILLTIPVALFWMAVVPAIGLFLLGKKIGNRNGG